MTVNVEELRRRRGRLIAERVKKIREILNIYYQFGAEDGNTFETAFIDLLTDSLHLGEIEKVQTAFIETSVALALDLYHAEHPAAVTALAEKSQEGGQA